MPHGRPRSHRAPRRHTARWLGAAVAPVLTLGVVATGVAGGSGAGFAAGQGDRVRLSGTGARAALDEAITDRDIRLDRSSNRAAHTSVDHQMAVPDKIRWATEDLDVRSTPAADAQVVGTLDQGHKVAATGVESDGFAQVQVDGRLSWVTAQYLTDKKPTTNPADMGLATTPCPGTSSVMAGLVPGAVRVYEAVCNNFPQITRYLGRGPRPEHDTGHAIDVMTTDTKLGYEIAAFLQDHAAELNLYDIIYRQHIWTPVRASEGWRLMPDRGSPTANHMDHVHVAVN